MAASTRWTTFRSVHGRKVPALPCCYVYCCSPCNAEQCKRLGDTKAVCDRADSACNMQASHFPVLPARVFLVPAPAQAAPCGQPRPRHAAAARDWHQCTTGLRQEHVGGTAGGSFPQLWKHSSWRLDRRLLPYLSGVLHASGFLPFLRQVTATQTQSWPANERGPVPVNRTSSSSDHSMRGTSYSKCVGMRAPMTCHSAGTPQQTTGRR